ncbi:MAG: P-II family nitrogen regulator [Nitrososphaerota archaeon]
MKKIEVIIRPEKISDVKSVLIQNGVGGFTMTEATGWSKQRELHLQWRGQKIAYDLIPKIKIEIVVPDSMVENLVRSIVETARTDGGREGDGIIFVTTVDEAVNIVTSLSGERAIVHSTP